MIQVVFANWRQTVKHDLHCKWQDFSNIYDVLSESKTEIANNLRVS